MKDKILNVIMVISILALIGAGYREYLIHNGKLTSDLNANGYSITNLPAGFFPAETDPTVPSWAKEAAPPSETDPTVPAWAKAPSAPLPPDYVAVSNAAKSAATPQQLAAKQDKLPYPTNAIPQGAVSGLSTALNGKLDNGGGTLYGSLYFEGEDRTEWDFINLSNAGEYPGGMTIGYKTYDRSFLFNSWDASFNMTTVRLPADKGGTLALTSDIPAVDLTPATNYTDSTTSALDASLSSRLSLASLAATNYTDEAIGAAIAPANPVFSNAVLSVGLGIDTNTVAAINALVEAGEELPIGGATSVGALLLALAAAVAALKRTKADASALRYAMPESVALVAENDAATLVCADRAVTNATIASGFSTLNLTFPAEASGYVRDFYLRITVAAGESAPAISVPQGITIENAGGAVPEIADGEASAAATTLVWFSETAPGIFTAKSETVSAVA